MEFYFNKKSNSVKAAGILFIDQKNCSILFQEVVKKDGNIYCDFGGKIDEDDEDILDIATRELLEESNNAFFHKKKDNIKLFDKNHMKKYILKNLLNTLYIPKSKYVVFIVKITNSLKINKSIFGQYESIDKIKRNILWININLVNTLNLHPRLWNRNLNDYLQTLDTKNNKFMFND